MTFSTFKQKLITRVNQKVFVFGKYFEVRIKDANTILLTSIAKEYENNPDLITFQIFDNKIIGNSLGKSVFVGIFHYLDDFDLEIDKPIQDWMYFKG